MKPLGASKLGQASLVTVFALLSIAANPPRKQTEAYPIQLIAIDVKSVRVSPAGKGSGAELSIRLRKEAQPELKDSLTQLKLGRVRIMDGGTLITEARSSGIIGGDHHKLVGLVLSFKTLEEADKVAAALRVTPREMKLVPVNHWVQATLDCASCDFLSLWSSAPDPGR